MSDFGTAGPLITRAPHARALQGWVGRLWAGGASSRPPSPGTARERVLPTGLAHLVVRLEGPPVRLLDSEADPVGRKLGHCLVGGPRDATYLRGLDSTGGSVGVELRPGAAQALFGLPAWELAGAHWSLEDLWGHDASQLRERLLDDLDPARQISLLEGELLRRLPTGRELHPAVALALDRLPAGVGMRAIVRESGYSHRRLLTLFRAAVGLTPQSWQRVRRFRRAVAGLHAGVAPAGVAADAGYADQPHLGREFRRIAGLTPAQYRRLRPSQPNHVTDVGQ